MNIPALNAYSFACNTAFEIISVLMFHVCIIYTKLHIFFTVSASNVTILPPLPVGTVTTITGQSATSSVPLQGKYKALHLYVIYIFFSNFVVISISQRHEKKIFNVSATFIVEPLLLFNKKIILFYKLHSFR